jgi:hypothetical protein
MKLLRLAALGLLAGVMSPGASIASSASGASDAAGASVAASHSVASSQWGALTISAPPSQLAVDARIFVIITNISMDAQRFPEQPLCRLTDVIVVDSDDKVRPRDSEMLCPNELASPPPELRLVTNQSYKGAETWNEPELGDPLALWGYHLDPGTYTIIAVPTRELWFDHRFLQRLVTSNSIKISLH